MYKILSKDQENYINSLNGLQKAKTIKEIFMSEDKLEVPNDVYGVVYKITNLNNDKVYIGSTKNYNERVSNYIASTLNVGIPAQRTVEKILRGEGILNFRIKKIGFAYNDNDLRELEIKEIRGHKALESNYGYNSSAIFIRYQRRSSNEAVKKKNV